MLYCSPIGGVKGNIEAGWGRPSTACKFLLEKMRIFKIFFFHLWLAGPGPRRLTSWLCPSFNHSARSGRHWGCRGPQLSETGNLTRTGDDHDDGDEDLDDFDNREIAKAHRGWIKMTLSVQENPFLIPVSSVRMHSFSWENGYCLILG